MLPPVLLDHARNKPQPLGLPVPRTGGRSRLRSSLGAFLHGLLTVLLLLPPGLDALLQPRRVASAIPVAPREPVAAPSLAFPRPVSGFSGAGLKRGDAFGLVSGKSVLKTALGEPPRRADLPAARCRRSLPGAESPRLRRPSPRASPAPRVASRGPSVPKNGLLPKERQHQSHLTPGCGLTEGCS